MSRLGSLEVKDFNGEVGSGSKLVSIRKSGNKKPEGKWDQWKMFVYDVAKVHTV